jgi:hypothetical protein
MPQRLTGRQSPDLTMLAVNSFLSREIPGLWIVSGYDLAKTSLNATSIRKKSPA